MIEQLITWTYTQEVDFFTKEVIRELAKRAPEDYVKDFFKWLLFHLNGSSINTKILEKANVADTICDPEVNDPIKATPIDPPTMSITITVNTSPLAG